MQQTQAQLPAPTPTQKRKRKRVSRSVRIGIACIAIFAILTFWILTIIGVIPTLWGITADKLGGIASAVITALGVFFAYVPIVPVDDESEPSVSVAPASPPSITIINNIPNIPNPSPLVPSPPSPIPPPLPSPAYRGMAQPPTTNPKTIQQRESVVKDVYAKLTQPDISALVLVGIGGLGKSTLAALIYNYAEKQRLAGKGPFKRETLWLRVDEKTTFLNVADDMFNALGNKPSGFEQLAPQSQAFALVHLLSTLDPPLLIVLDQFENLLNLDTGEALTPETGELLDALNSRSCPSRILLTSRPHPKGIRMTTYDSLYLYPVHDLTLAEGQALLKGRGVTATEDDLQTAVQRCKGHSLSLCLLASLLDENKLGLSTLLRDPAYRQLWDKDVATKLLDEIYTKCLSDEQRELIQALSIYREAVPQNAVLPLLSNTAQTHINVLLRTLQAHQLVQVVEAGRRQLHPIVVTYAQQRDEQFNKAAMHIAHSKAAQYYVQQAEKTCPPLDERRSIRDVQPLIEAVWQFCQAEQWQAAYELMDEESLFDDVRRWGGNVILLEIGQNVLIGKTLLEPLQVAGVYHDLGWVCDNLGKKEDALKYYQQSLAIYQKQGERKSESATLVGLGRVYNGLGQKQEALKYYEQALHIFGEVGDRGGEGTTLWNIGALSQSEKHYDVALSAFILSKHIFVEVQSPHSDSVQEWIDDLHQEIGDKKFAALLKNVEPQAQHIVDKALSELQ
ncbi:MAG: hypothetical protein NVSMB49_13660 [Ktedonobacteraceae bacterium]